MIAFTRQKDVTTDGAGGLEYATPWQLIWRKFSKHKLAVISLNVLVFLYLLAIFAEFFSPYSRQLMHLNHVHCPPQPIRFNFRHGWYTVAMKRHVDPVSLQSRYEQLQDQVVPLSFFVRGEEYKHWGLLKSNIHFFGVDLADDEPGEVEAHDTSTQQATFFLLGADKYGRDLFSRVIYGARISLSVGLVGIVLTFFLGLIIGGISGYVGGWPDNLIQRTMEILNAVPGLPLWLALAAAMPDDWSPLKVYFGITVVLSLLGWTGLARVVRGKLLALREEDYAVAVKLLGASDGRIIFRHLLPGFTSHIIVSLTLSVPGMILGETALSFLGLGLRPPVVSWGVLLQDAQNIQAVAHYPWLLLPVLFVVVVVLAFNFLGDGMRDAADPYAR